MRRFSAIVLLAFSASGCFAQALSPQVLAAIEYYFRGPGASNSIPGAAIRDGAITLVKVDTGSLAGYFVSKAYLQSLGLLEAESDPVWESEKSLYLPRTESGEFLTGESDPVFVSWRDDGVSVSFTNASIGYTNVVNVYQGRITNVVYFGP